MPDAIQKQFEEKQLAQPTTRFSSKYFFPTDTPRVRGRQLPSAAGGAHPTNATLWRPPEAASQIADATGFSPWSVTPKYSQQQKKPTITKAPRHSELFQTAFITQQTFPQTAQTEFTLASITTGFRERALAVLSYLIFLFSAPSSQNHRQAMLALAQLKYLAALCSATSHFTNDEELLFNAAFGEAYYNITQNSKALRKKNNEQELHLHSSFKSLLRSLDSV